MARLASQAKGGFFGAPPAAVSKMLEYLAPPQDGSGFHIFDPCAGEGEAIKQLAEGLNCRPSDVWAIELSEHRAPILAENLPEANILGPCSFFGSTITSKAFGLIWCNPPYGDQEFGQDRIERHFLEKATAALAPGGIMAFVIPEPTSENHAVREFLLTWFEDLSLVRFPSQHRKYKECVVFGRKLKSVAIAFQRTWNQECQYYSGDRPATKKYEIPGTLGPNRFLKTELTDAELLKELSRSPLRRHLQPPDELPLPSPPLSLGQGHLALLLAAGHLDGIVRPPDEPPHIVRGTAKKVSYVVDKHVEKTKESTTTKTTTSEKIVLTVRVLTPSGIKTLSQE